MAADPSDESRDGMPDEAAVRLYLTVLDAGGRIPIAGFPEADRPALDRLVRIGLILPNPIDGAYLAVSPRAVSDRVGAEMRSQASRLLREAEQLPGSFAELTRAYDAMPRAAANRDSTEYIDGRDRIRHRIAELVSDCKDELITVQPGAREEATIELARRQDEAFIRRGGRLRTLYQPVVLTQPVTIGYAVALTTLGAGIRVLDEPFLRMIIVDRKVAVIPTSDDHSGAAFLSDPAAVAFLVAGFERDWARADAVQWHEVDHSRVSNSVADRVGRLLAGGLTQRGIATRLGLSERTVAAHISRLRDRYGAQTLFQLGWLMRGSRRD